MTCCKNKLIYNENKFCGILMCRPAAYDQFIDWVVELCCEMIFFYIAKCIPYLKFQIRCDIISTFRFLNLFVGHRVVYIWMGQIYFIRISIFLKFAEKCIPIWKFKSVVILFLYLDF